MEKNWNDNWRDVPFDETPHNANIIGSPIAYKNMKNDAKAGSVEPELKLKAQICVDGNQDDERWSMRSDAAEASHTSFRMLYSIAMMFDMTLAKVDIRGAYIQSGEAHRDIYVRPPRVLQRWNVL